MKLEYQHAILSYFIFLFRLLMAKSGKNLTVRRWHHLLMPESKGKRPWLLISRTLVWWMRTSAAVPYSSTLMVLMQEIRYVFFLPCFFPGYCCPSSLFSSYIMYCCPVTSFFSRPSLSSANTLMAAKHMFYANKKAGGKCHVPFAELTLR